MELPTGAMFCGECGRAVGARSPALSHIDSGMPIETPAWLNPGDTAIIDPIDLEQLRPETPSEEAAVESEPVADPAADAVEISDQIVAIEQDLPPEIEDAVDAPLDPPQEAARAYPDPFPWGRPSSVVSTDSHDLESTIIVPRREQGERFVLQFSTGESVTVFGSGLLGRNPSPQPGEFFDQLVTLSDPGKSVSKTHLEFGQESGSFWVGDRFSGNGSIVREPESAPHRLTSGKRYRIVRGTRVDIGEQFFIVS
ncbi:MAG TPA: hypothetical protein VIJ76_01750 [Galbitalea sp.]